MKTIKKNSKDNKNNYTCKCNGKLLATRQSQTLTSKYQHFGRMPWKSPCYDYSKWLNISSEIVIELKALEYLSHIENPKINASFS